MRVVKRRQPVVSAAREHDLAVRPGEHGTGALRSRERRPDGGDGEHCPHAELGAGRPTPRATTGALSLDVTS